MSDSGSSSNSGSGGNAFTISHSQIKFASNLALGTSIPGTCTCFLILLGYAFAALFPKARKNLDRVSFRLLAYSLVFNVLFGIAYAATPTAPGPGCNFSAFAVNFFVGFSTFFTTCIAINLQLVLVHGVDGKRMEKYYVLGTVLLTLALTVPTLALNQFGWDEGSSVCWYKNPDPRKRLRWIIGTELFWVFLASTIEVVCSGVVIVWIYRFDRITQNLVKAASDTTLNETTKKSSMSLFRSTRSSWSTQFMQDPRYRNVILRIALYPIVSLILNCPTMTLGLKMTIQGLKSELDYRLLVLDLIVIGLRTLAYGLLAATDPAFISAIREIRGGGKEGTRRAPVRMLTTIQFATDKAKSEVLTVAGDRPCSVWVDTEKGSGGGEALDVEELRKLEQQL